MDLSSGALGTLGGSSGIPGGGGGDKISPAQKKQVINALKQQLQIAKLQKLVEDANTKCFKLCVPKPGTSLSSSEQRCVTQCVERFIDATNVIGKAYGAKLESMMNQGGH